MDDALLQRFPTKIEIILPTDEEYGQIFEIVCAQINSEILGGFVDRLMAIFDEKHGLLPGHHQPQFTMERIIDKAQYSGEAPISISPRSGSLCGA